VTTFLSTPERIRFREICEPHAAVALVRVVMMFAGVRESRALVENEAAAKISVVLAPKNIPVGDAAPSINTKTALWVFGAHHFIPGERFLGGTFTFDVLTSPQNSPTRVVASSQGEIKGHLDRMCQQARSGYDAQFVGWRLAGVFDGNYGRYRYLIFGAMDVNVSSPCDDIGSQLPLPGASHYKNGGYQRKELEERDSAGDHSDLVAQAPSIKPRSENVTAHPVTISEFRSRNMGLSRAPVRPRGAREVRCWYGRGHADQTHGRG
jgi:hypothetical protein